MAAAQGSHSPAAQDDGAVFLVPPAPRPAWVQPLVDWFMNNRALMETGPKTAALESLPKATGDRTGISLPAWFLDAARPNIPGVWPLEGHVKAAFHHWYAQGTMMTFPPPGHALEISYTGALTKGDMGNLHRSNLDVMWFAWLLAGKTAAAEGKESPRMCAWVKAANNIACHLNKVAGPEASLVMAYQSKEDEEKSAQFLGLDVLGRAKVLASLADRFSLGEGIGR